MIGIDIASISRIQKFVNKFGKKGLRRFLSKKELKLATKIETIAGFWATKEAVSKALGCGIGKELGFLDIQILKTKKCSKGKTY
jgi:holo-[acyl-carrier protein] synthase